jgi:hypothetical protein
MRKLFASALLILAIFAETPVANPQPGAQADGKLVVAQKFCPRGC